VDDKQRLAHALDPNRAELRAYQPTLRDRIASFFVGDERASPEKARLVEGLFGSRGLGNTGMGLVDLTPAGAPLWTQEFKQAQSPTEAIAAALNFVPGAKGAAQGAKAVADDVIKAYHGSPHLFDALNTSEPAWLTTTPQTAQRFAVDRAEYGGYKNRAQADRLQGEGKIHVYEAGVGGRVLEHDPMAEAIETARKAGIPEPETWDDAAEILRWADYQREVIERAREGGFDAVRFKNVGDDPMGEVSDHIAVLNANAINGFKRQEPQTGGYMSDHIANLMKMVERYR
jgi:hypothetical protein